MDNKDNMDIKEIEDIINAANSTIFTEKKIPVYLRAIAQTQLLILNELRNRGEYTCQK